MKLLYELHLSKPTEEVTEYHPVHHANVKAFDKGWIVRVIEAEELSKTFEAVEASFSFSDGEKNFHVVIVRDIQLP